MLVPHELWRQGPFLQAWLSSVSENFSTSTLKHGVVHEIHTVGPPVSCQPRRLSPDRLKLVKEEFTLMEEMGLIRCRSSPWGSPLHIVEKPNGREVVCVILKNAGEVRQRKSTAGRVVVPGHLEVHYDGLSHLLVVRRNVRRQCSFERCLTKCQTYCHRCDDFETACVQGRDIIVNRRALSYKI